MNALAALALAWSLPVAQPTIWSQTTYCHGSGVVYRSMTAIHGGQWPCVDSLLWRGCYRETEWLSVVELYRPYCGGSAPDYPGYRAATVALVLDLRRAGTPDCALRLLVRKMMRIEHDIPVSSGGRRVAEPIQAPEAPEE